MDINAAGKVLNDKKEEGEISINDLKKYIAYARMKCSPRLNDDSGEALK